MSSELITIDAITDVEKHLDGIEAIIFDLDDTLYPEKSYVRSGYQKIAEHFKMPELESEFWEVFERGGKAIDEVFEAHGIMELKDEALHLYRFQKPNIHLYYGVAEMLERLRKSYKVGIITDGRPEGQYAKIETLGIQVDEIIITDELGGIEYRKPNPAAYILMQKRMRVPFERMMYVGDNLNKDFQVPKDLGMLCVWFNNCSGLYRFKIT